MIKTQIEHLAKKILSAGDQQWFSEAVESLLLEIQFEFYEGTLLWNNCSPELWFEFGGKASWF